jgi:hypothetical protein
VICLGWPKAKVAIQSMQLTGRGQVELLGYDGDIILRLNEKKQPIVVVPRLLPDQRPCRHAFAIKLTGFDISLHPDARFNMPRAITLPPEKVTLEGSRVRVQDAGGRPNIGAWDNTGERVHWLVHIREAGTYAIRGEFSSAYGASGLKMTLLGKTRTASVPKTKGWFNTVFVSLGRFEVNEPGVYQLTLEPADPDKWKAVNVWQIQMAPVD